VKVAYLVSRFPKVSETFILDEILALERRGFEVELFAFVRERSATAHPEAEQLTARCRVASRLSPALWIAPLFWLVRAPRASLAIWTQVLWANRRSARLGARALAVLWLSSAYALAILRGGAHHIHAHWATHPALGAWVIHRLTGLSYSFTAHADDLFVQQNLLAEKAHAASFVVTISEYNRRFLAAHCGQPTPRIEVVRCGVRTDTFSPPGPAPGSPFRVLCIARLEAKKGQATLIEACAELVRRGVDVRCDLIGDGTDRDRLAALAAERGLADRVRLLGPQPRERVRAHLARACAVALPSSVRPNGRRDGIPVALMEAMAMERPVVSTPVSGIPELVVNEESGLLVAPGDPQALADALARLAADPGLGRRLGAAGRRRVVAEFDLERNVDRLARLFGALAGAPAPVLRDVRVAGHAPREASG